MEVKRRRIGIDEVERAAKNEPRHAPDISLRNRLTNTHVIVGVDEVGRGAWAGPLVAAALVIEKPALFPYVAMKDSKLLSDAQRRRLLPLIQSSSRIAYGMVSNRLLDRIGLQAANVLAIDQALRLLEIGEGFEIHADHVGGFKRYTIHSIPISFHIHGESRFFEIAAASVAAKVFRDDLMRELHTQFPDYGFDRHKGYGTLAHRAAIQKYGVSHLHRNSFQLL